jgi:hypothetical protein
MPKILADENVHSDIVSRLRDQGYDVLFVPDIGLAGSKNPGNIGFIKKAEKIITRERKYGFKIS